MESIETYLRVNKENFESVIKRANQEAIDEDPNNKDLKKDLLFPNAEIILDEIYVEDKSDEISLRGELWSFGKNLAWIDLKIPFNQEMAKDIIERYIKKLQKLKTILEATKD